MLRYQFLCHVLKAYFFAKITLKLIYFCEKMQNFRALGAPFPEPQNSPPPLRIFDYAPGSAHRHRKILAFGSTSFRSKILGMMMLCNEQEYVRCVVKNYSM